MARKGTVCYGLTGGAAGNLDAIVSTSVTDNSIVITIDTAKFYTHYYDTSSASAESSPDVIKPDNLGVGDAGRWLLLDVWTGLAALDAIGALTPAANKIPHFTSATAATALEITANTFPARSSAGNIAAKAITDFALTLLDDATAAALKTTSLAAGDVVQIVNTQTGAVATGTTAIPNDDTIPQITEGDEFMTLAITPTSATNKLKIEVVCHLSNSNANQWTAAALFQDATAGALAVGTGFTATAASGMSISFVHYMVAGTIAATTFRVRGGSQTGATTTFNGTGGSRYYGGVMASSITITEIMV